MPYSSSLNDQVYRIDTGEQDPQREITIDGTTYKIDWRFIAPLAVDTKGPVNTGGRYSLLLEGKSYEVFARRLTKFFFKQKTAYEIQFAGQRFEVRVEDERERALAGSV